jgi:ubiquitin carboxyl-terminal hydrolase 36/42
MFCAVPIDLPVSHCSFRPGRQEDAHEYLVALLDAMHESSLLGLKAKPPREVEETSLIYCIFSGKICSQVQSLPL